jgi:hypothetical protein
MTWVLCCLLARAQPLCKTNLRLLHTFWHWKVRHAARVLANEGAGGCLRVSGIPTGRCSLLGNAVVIDGSSVYAQSPPTRSLRS